MPKKSLPVGALSVMPSITESYLIPDKATKFIDEKCIIEGAALFGPPFDPRTGHYITISGNHYAPGFHESLMESSDGAMGWDYHPDGPPDRKVQRQASKATHKIVEGSLRLDRSGPNPLVRGDVKFIGKDKASNYEIAREGAHKLGFSAYMPRPLGMFDPKSGFEVIHKIDPSEKRNVSFDLVEASGATGDITEDAGHSETTMNQEEIAKLIADAVTANNDKLKKDITESMEPALKSAREANARAATIERTQLVQSRLAAGKLEAGDTTSALVAQLSVCESADAMDKLIVEQKSFLAKRTPTVHGAGGGSTQTVELGAMRGIDAALESCGYSCDKTAAQRGDAVKKFLATPHGMAVMSPVSESCPNQGQWSFQHRHDVEVSKLRKEFIESSSLHRFVERSIGRPVRSMRDVEEAALDTTGFQVINAALLAAIMIEAYDVAGENLVVDEITQKYDSTLISEVIPGYSSPSGVGTQQKEGDLAPVATMGQKGAQDHYIPKNWVRVIVTREEYLHDQKGMVIMRANSVAEQLRVIRNLRKMFVITDQTAAFVAGAIAPANVAWQQYRPLVVDGGGNATYPVQGLFTAGNTVTNNALRDYTSVEKAVELLKAQTDENGNRLFTNSARPLHFLIPDTLEFQFWHVMNAFGTQLRTNNQANIMEGANPFANSVRHMDSTLSTMQATTAANGGDPVGTWYIAGAGGFQKQYVDKRVIPFEVVQIPQSEVQSVSADVIAGVKAAYKEDVVPRDFKFVVKCTP